MVRAPLLTWSAALSDTHPDPAKRRDGPRTNVALCGIAYAVLGGGFINKWFKEEDQQGITGSAEGRGGCPVGTARHPLRPWVGRADEHTDPLFPTEKV